MDNMQDLERLMKQTREERLNEVGTEPPCPWCSKPRVKRSVYIRCNPCGTNWFKGDDLMRDPRTKPTAPISMETSDGALTAS
jgi:ribosomal protein L37AE/L43A